MGNKQGCGGGGSQMLSPSSETLANPSLTSDAINTLTNCLKELPIALDQRVTDEVVRRVELVQIEDTARTLLKKDHDPPGIYVLLSGNVEVVSEGQKFVLRRIKEGDCFGEVSVLFNIKCTADVKAVDRCDLLFLNLDDARQLLILSEEVTLLQWFQRRMEPLEAVVNTVKPDAVVLYQDQSLIFKEGWKGQEMFILVYGQVAMFTGDQELATFDAGHRGFTFGEEGFFTGTERRSTVRRVTSELLEIMAAEGGSSEGSSSDSSDDDSMDDLELLLLQNVFCGREFDVHLNFEDISEDDFPSLFRKKKLWYKYEQTKKRR
ncbi:hypothetical protein P5673_019584 [Acropora cervicornis]|uniref:Cyclic nucleotide-binding domain-containing protein n=1 Tax=Acropora cervicornis TaxID=6130 RepID=A0AAD9V1R5_ACRCE|nr:hypothetical protein P5673_019584 [Acropora cervicornis]